jgi:hypothetical protein
MEITLPPFEPHPRRKIHAREKVLELLKAGDRLVAHKTHEYNDVERCWMQHEFGTVTIKTFKKLLSDNLIEPVGKPAFDGTNHYQIKGGK